MVYSVIFCYILFTSVICVHMIATLRAILHCFWVSILMLFEVFEVSKFEHIIKYHKISRSIMILEA